MKFLTIATATFALFIAGALAIPYPQGLAELVLPEEEVPITPDLVAPIDDAAEATLVDGVVDVTDIANAASAAKCVVPSTFNKAIAKQIRKRACARHVSKRLLLAIFEAAWVESHVNNLHCGDRDSLGVFQQRPSAGWCSPSSLCLNVIHATDKFISEAVRVAKPSMTAGQLAQAVQRSGFPLRYDQSQAKAKSIIAAIGGYC